VTQRLAGSRILINAPTADELDSLRVALEHAGASVITTRSPQEAFDAFQADPPDALVSDLDGARAPDHKLIRQIRGLRTGRGVPAVAVSSLSWETHRADALAAGFSQWISKPAEQAVVEVVAALIRPEAAGAARPPSPPPGASIADTVIADLGLLPFSETVRRLWRERRSGDLLVRFRRTTRMVFFDEGEVVFAASNVRKERLGEALVALGAISGDGFHRASAMMAQKKLRFGDALVAAGIMKKDEVGLSVARWVEQLVLPLFALTSGGASFDERPCVIPKDYRVNLGTERLLHKGVRTMQNHDLVLRALGQLDRRVVAARAFPFSLDAEDKEILDLAQEPVSLRRLAWTSAGFVPDRARTVYALVASSALEDVAAPPARPARVSLSARPATKPPEPPSDPHGPLREEIRQQLEHSESLDSVAWLGISASAPKADLVRALEQRRASYEALLKSLGHDAGMSTDLELLLGRVSMALRLAQGASPRKEEPAPVPVAAATTAESAPPPAPSPEPASATNVSMEVEHLLMEAGVRMSVGDFANAARTYARLVDLRPEVAEYHVRLAIALSRSPKTARQAEAAFNEALHLDPENAEIHYQLGVYYGAMNVRSRSIVAFREAMRLDPRHKKARAEVEALSPRDSALDGLKRLLK
jgi:DNA-binding response OmpR family regulator